MRVDDSGLVLDKGFEEATTIVTDAFATQGFAVTTTAIGDDRNAAHPHQPRRYVQLCATLPELTFGGAENSGSSLLGCKLSVIELNPASTLLAADEPLASYPLLAGLIPRVVHRVNDALERLARQTAIRAAA